MDDVEKSPPESDHISHNEQLNSKEKAEKVAAQFVTPTAQEEKAVIRKLDFRLIPIVFFLYMLSVLDRANLGNARLAGLEVRMVAFSRTSQVC